MSVAFLVGIFFTIGLLPALSQTSNPSALEQPAQLVQQGQERYQQGQFQEAVEDLDAAASGFAEQGKSRDRATTLSNLSLAYQQLGQWEQAETAITESLTLLGVEPSMVETDTIPSISPSNMKVLAPTLDIYGRLWYQRGKTELALDSWQQAEAIYQQLNQEEGRIGSKINQVQALQTLGLYRQARATIEAVQQSLESLPTPLQIQGWRSLGEVLRTVGDLDNSQEFLQQSLTLAQESNEPQESAATLLSLGNTFWALGNLERDRQSSTGVYNLQPWSCQSDDLPEEATEFYTQADEAYQQATNRLPQSIIGVKAKLNRFNLLVETDRLNAAEQVWQQIDLAALPKTRTGVYAHINLARHLVCWRQKSLPTSDIPSWQEIDRMLEEAIDTAKQLQDSLALSYAVGNRGSFYEYLASREESNSSQLQTAQKLTTEALLLVQPSEVPSIAYQWQWQQGRILELEGKSDQALDAYEQALSSLVAVRNDLLAINSDVQFSFRDNVEPVYRKLVDLLLSDRSDSEDTRTQLLDRAIAVIDSLQLAELENFLRCDLSSNLQIDRIAAELDPEAAFIYPIILENRLEIIFKLPQQPLKRRSTIVNHQQVEQTISQLQTSLARPDLMEEVQEDAQKLYSWIIQPLEKDLQAGNPNNQPKTLVFILDGALRNIPMSVLYDREQYLIEKYAVAVIPSRQLFDPRSRQKSLQVLKAGISQEREVDGIEFPALSYVPQELNKIRQLSASSSELLLDQAFTDRQFQEKVDSTAFPIVHIATHGEFNSDPSTTFILAWNKRIPLPQLEQILNRRDSEDAIELLVLSACQTAQGNRRAALGMAGVAAQAGVRSTLASLWQVDDQTTASLMTKFYAELKQGKSLAAALQQAELSLLQNEETRPYYWAPFVLIGNWL
ncbi:MAG: hypothetical protein Tsb0014_05110 [Pleurocapsa sp.]